MNSAEFQNQFNKAISHGYCITAMLCPVHKKFEVIFINSMGERVMQGFSKDSLEGAFKRVFSLMDQHHG